MSDHAPPPDPLVIVEGFLCATSSIVWGNFNKHVDIGSEQVWQEQQSNAGASVANGKRRVIFAPVGPVSSIHDRACELFYALRGGTVDYGAQHAAAHGHRRYGRHHKVALLPQWASLGADGKPKVRAHFVGHSLGGLTILKLYDLLSQGFFDEALQSASDHKRGIVTSPSAAIVSILTISSPLRGTPMVYTLGLDPSVALPRLQTFSPGDMLAKFVHIASWLRRLPLRALTDLSWLPDFHADAWDFAGYADGTQEHADTTAATSAGPSLHTLWDGFGVRSLFAQLRRSIWAEGTDCAPWDCTFAQRELIEGSGGIWSGWSQQHGEGWKCSHPEGESNDRRSSPVWLRSVAATVSDLDDIGNHNGDQGRSLGSWSVPLGPLDIGARYLNDFDYKTHRPPRRHHPIASARKEEITTDSGYASEAEDHLQSRSQTQSKRDIAQLHSDLIRGDGQQQDPEDEAYLAEWRANDGVVPLASQYHPGPCRPGHCKHYDAPQQYAKTSIIRWCLRIAQTLSPIGGKVTSQTDDTSRKINESYSNLDEDDPAPGVWHVTRTSHTSHATLAPLWIGSEQQVAFWQDVGRWLAQVEKASAEIK